MTDRAPQPAPAATRPLRIGFLALTDVAPLIVAQEQGWFAAHGLRVELHREVGWATVRDKVLYGELDAAHAPAPMLWSTQLGLGCGPADVCTGFVFNLHGNALTLSSRLWDAGVRDGASLRQEAQRRRGENRLTFGIVFTHSMHHVLLRRWLIESGIDPERDVRIAVVPPAQMFRNLVAGTLDGYCVGEPWNTLAVEQNQGWCPLWSATHAPALVEKVLLVRTAFAERRASEHAALIAALTDAARWCDQPANRAPLADLLASPACLDLPAAVIRPALLGQFSPRPGVTESVPDFHIFHRGDANAPTAARALAIQQELAAAALVPRSRLSPSLPQRLFREDLHREATTNLDPHATPPNALPGGHVTA